MKNLLQFLKGYIKETILGPLFKLAEATLELIVPLIIAAIVDIGIKNSDTGYITGMCLLLVGMGAVGLLFSVTAQYFSAKAAVGFVKDVRRSMFLKMQSLSYRDIDKIGTSTMITRMTADAQKLQNGLNLTLRLLLRSPFVVFGAMIMAFTVDFDSALSFVAVIPALSIVVFGIMFFTMPMYKKSQAGTDSLLEKARENLSGTRVIRAFCKEEDEVGEFEKRNDTLTRVQKNVSAISALTNPLTYVLINLAIVWLIQIGAVRVESGELTQGEVIALYNYMSQILIELVKLANLIISISRALASAKRISDVLNVESTDICGTRTSGIEGESAVEFRSVSLTYDGAGEESLSDISFVAGKGQTIGIIGGTGSGKTSLVNLIPGFYTPTGGEVLIDGVPTAEYDISYLRDRIGIVPQKAVLFKGSIRENMLWGDKTATDEQIYEALRIAQADGVVLEKGGLDALIEQGGTNLSGGQRQRLTIARALVGNPSILILDDSASALDYATDASLRVALKNLDGDTTIFIVSQRASSVMHADLIIVLDDGRAVSIGTHEELLADCDIYREIYNSQFGGSTNG